MTHFSDTYRAMIDVFGTDVLEPLWPSLSEYRACENEASNPERVT